MIASITDTIHRYPGKFWTLMGASFIDHLGFALLFPFFSLYITAHFEASMTQVGILFLIFSAASQIGSMVGGALADRFGRKKVILIGLVFSASSSVIMAFVNELRWFYLIAAVVGFLGELGKPAQQAMVADLLAEEQRTEGYGIWRVVSNLAFVFGPTIGGFLATNSYLWLFIADAVSSTITALVVLTSLPETKPEKGSEEPEEGLQETFRGYRKVASDGVFMAFLAAFTLLNTVYVQKDSTLPVFLRDVHNSPPEFYGGIMSLNAGMVVAFQFWVTRLIKKYPPMLVMMVGGGFYLVGFTMYGFVFGTATFALAMVLITIGEMVTVPVSQALAAQFAPEDMRGRYMAVSELAWGIPFAVGPILGGVIVDNYDPIWVWNLCGILALGAMASFFFLQLESDERLGHETGIESQAAG